MGRSVTGRLVRDISRQSNDLTLKVRPLHCLSMSGTTHPLTQHPIQKKLTIQSCICERHEGVWENELTSKLDGRVYKLHAPVALAPCKELPVPIEEKAMCTRVSVWTLQGSVASLPPVGNLTLYPRLTNRGLITIPTAPSGIPVVIISRTKNFFFLQKLKRSRLRLQKLIVFRSFNQFSLLFATIEDTVPIAQVIH